MTVLHTTVAVLTRSLAEFEVELVNARAAGDEQWVAEVLADVDHTTRSLNAATLELDAADACWRD